MKKFSALLVAITLVTMFFASAAFAADTYVYSDLYGKVGFLKISDDKIVALSTDNKGIYGATLGTNVKLFANGQDTSTAIAGGTNGFVGIKPDATDPKLVVLNGTKTTKSDLGQVSSYTKSGDSIAVVGDKGLYVKTKTLDFTSKDSSLKAAVPQVGVVPAITDVAEAAAALETAIAKKVAETPTFTTLAPYDILYALTDGDTSVSDATTQANSIFSTALIELLKAMDKTSDVVAVKNGALVLADRDSSSTSTPAMADDISTYSPVKKFTAIAPLAGKFYLAGETGIKTLEAGTTLASFYAALSAAAEAIYPTSDLSIESLIADLVALAANEAADAKKSTSNLAGIVSALGSFAKPTNSVTQALKASDISAENDGDATSKLIGTATTETVLAGSVSMSDLETDAGLIAGVTDLATAAAAMDAALNAYYSAMAGGNLNAAIEAAKALNAPAATLKTAIQAAVTVAVTGLGAADNVKDLATDATNLTAGLAALAKLADLDGEAETIQENITAKSSVGIALITGNVSQTSLLNAVTTVLGAQAAMEAGFIALADVATTAQAFALTNGAGPNELTAMMKAQTLANAALTALSDLVEADIDPYAPYLAANLRGAQTEALTLETLYDRATKAADAAKAAAARSSSHTTSDPLAEALLDLADALTDLADQTKTVVEGVSVQSLAGDEVNGKLYMLDSTSKKVYSWDGTKSADVTSGDLPTFSALGRPIEMIANGDSLMFIDSKALWVFDTTGASIDLVDSKNDVVAVARLNTTATFDGGNPDDPVTPPTPETPTVSLLDPSSLGDAGTKIVSAFSGAAATDFLTAAADVTSGDGTAANAAVKEAIEAKLQKEDDETVTTTAIKSFTFVKKGYILLSGSDIENVTLAETKTEVTARKFFFADEAGNVIEPKAFDENGNEVTTGSAKYLAAGEFPAGSTYTLYTAEKTKTTDDGGSTGSSSGGCNAGFAGIAALAALALIKKSK